MNNPILKVMALVCLFSVTSCRKYAEEQQKNLLLSVMTQGQWHVESYFEGVTPITNEFDGFNFQFQADGSVKGSRGSFSVTGSWTGDLSNYSIHSNFPSSDTPLVKLNGVWRITDSAPDFVAAEMSTAEGKNILRLKKNS